MKKSEKEKGSALSTVIIIILLILIVIAVFLFMNSGFGFGTGNGSGTGEAIPANAEVSSESDSETSATTTIQTEETKYFEITVSGNSYNFQNKTYESIDELMNAIDSTGDKLDAKITNEEASKNAYDNLVDALKENGFAIIEEN